MAGTDENTNQDENLEQNVNESQEQIEEDNQISEAVAAEIGIFENEIKNRREVWETGRDDTIIWSYIYDSFNKKITYLKDPPKMVHRSTKICRMKGKVYGKA